MVAMAIGHHHLRHRLLSAQVLFNPAPSTTTTTTTAITSTPTAASNHLESSHTIQPHRTHAVACASSRCRPTLRRWPSLCLNIAIVCGFVLMLASCISAAANSAITSQHQQQQHFISAIGRDPAILQDNIEHLLFTTYTDIRVANIRRSNGTSASATTTSNAPTSSGPPVSVEVLIKDLVEGAALDIDYARQLVCWTDQGLETIQCQSLITTSSGATPHKFSVVTAGLAKPEGLAIDWYTGKLYWTDGETDRIEVVQLDGRHRRVLFWSELDQPRAIALIPHRRLMIWSDWGETPKIERASMDGDPASRTVLVRENIFWPNGLVVDMASELVYWVDGHYQFLDVMRLDGSERRTIVRQVPYPYSVTKLASTLYWTDWHVGAIQSFNLATNETHELIDTAEVPLAVHAWDAALQPPPSEPSPCTVANGNCSHLCLLSAGSPRGYRCACPTGVKLLTEWRCADGPQEQLFLVQRTQISRISLDTPDHSSFPLQLDRVKYAIAIDYDPVDGYVYWSDEEAHAIRRARPDGSAQADIVSLEVAHPDGIAIDWHARNLYWTDTGTDRIEVCRLDGSARRAIVNEHLDEPRAIALAPQLGWMFWSDWNERNPKVERAAMDGSARTVLVSDGLGWPNGIAVDEAAGKIFWCDARTDRIEVIGMNGSGRRVLLNQNLPHVFGLSLLGDYLYWTDWQRRAIDRAHKETGGDRIVVVDQFPDLMGLKVTRTHETSDSGTVFSSTGVRLPPNSCATRNGECSHLCLNRPGGDYVCVCPTDHELSADRRRCHVPPAFLLFSKLDSIGTISLEFNEGNRNDYKIPFRELRDAHRQLDVDTAARRVYFTDSKEKCIWRAHLNGSTVERVVEAGLQRPEGVAVDWMAGNLFWADSEARRIEVARLTGTSRRVLLWRGIEEPRGLIVEPAHGLMYWSEWPSDSIRRAQMDGGDVQTIVAGANHATGLTQDGETRRVYWASQSRPKAIESVDWDGSNRRVIVAKVVDEPHAVALYGPWVYWGDWNTGDVERVNKVGGGNRTLIHSNLEYASSLLVFHAGKQNGSNGCTVRNGGCSHLCLAVPPESAGSGKQLQRGIQCACPTHYALGKDGTSCIAPKHYLIISQRSSFARLLPNASDAPDAPLPVSGKNVRAVDYDPVQHYVYWVESNGGKQASIRRALESETRAGGELVVSAVQSQPVDVAVDYVGRHLYWTCAAANAINVTSFNGEVIGNVDVGSDMERPRSIAVHSMRRLVFWTDVGLQAVFRARIDGFERRLLLGKLDGVSAMTVDNQLEMLFVAHGKCIEMLALDGTKRQILVSTHISHVVAIAALHSFVYWLDERTERTGVERISIAGDSRKPEVQRLRNITDIVAVWTPDARVLRNHSCTVSRAKCSHLCVVSGGVAQCACPPGMSLLDDGHNCGAPPICGPDHFTCASSDGGGGGGRSGERSRGGSVATAVAGSSAGGHDLNKDCIPVSWRCDGQNDCADKSDEIGCPKCHEDQFKCQSGECIDRAFVCDGTTNCADGYDEADCCKSVLDFQCPINKVCIPVAYLCDGWDHCADGADEAPDTCLATLSNNRKVPAGGAGSDKEMTIVIIVGVVVVAFAAAYVFSTRRLQGCRAGFGPGARREGGPKHDPAADPLSPGVVHQQNGAASLADHKSARVIKMCVNQGAIPVVAPVESMRMSNVHRGGGFGQMMPTAASIANSYDRNHITGASSSTTTTNHSSNFNSYPRQPPPSPATTTASTERYNTHRAYRHYKAINKPPPPTPCTTDVCDESDSQYSPYYQQHHPHPYGQHHHHQQQRPSSKSSRHSHHQQQHPRASSAFSMMHGASSPSGTDMLDREPFPPPPTPGSSHCHSDFGGECSCGEGRGSRGGGGGGSMGGSVSRHRHDSSCPPSPGSRSSTYFPPLPPPPSPVPGSGSGYS